MKLTCTLTLLAAACTGTALAVPGVMSGSLLPTGSDCKLAFEAETDSFWPFDMCKVNLPLTNAYCCFYQTPGVRRNVTYTGSCEDVDVTSYDKETTCYKYGK